MADTIKTNKVTKKTRAHIVYKNSEGIRIPGVTTIINSVLAKPALLKWAWQCGMNGEDYLKYRDKMGDIGTLAHHLIESHLKGQTPDTSEYTEEQISKAENCLLSFFEWEKGHKLEPVFLEEPMVSERWQVGGTVDFYGVVDGKQTLVDFKTSAALYTESVIQVGAYQAILEENGRPVDEVRILRIGRDETEGFEERIYHNLRDHQDIFFHCREIYNLRKKVR